MTKQLWCGDYYAVEANIRPDYVCVEVLPVVQLDDVMDADDDWCMTGGYYGGSPYYYARAVPEGPVWYKPWTWFDGPFRIRDLETAKKEAIKTARRLETEESSFRTKAESAL